MKLQLTLSPLNLIWFEIFHTEQLSHLLELNPDLGLGENISSLLRSARNLYTDLSSLHALANVMKARVNMFAKSVLDSSSTQ